MELPKRFQRFTEEFPGVAEAYEKLGHEIHSAGPIDTKMRALVKIGICAGARYEGAMHSHVRKALESGITKEEIRHAIMLALPTIGFPSTMAALSWADDILDEVK